MRRAWRARLGWSGRRILPAAFAVASACASRPPSTTAPLDSTHDRDACPTSLLTLRPSHARRWLWLRPHELYDHPQLGPLLGELTRDAGERALVAEAERAGVDPRTVDRALLIDRGESSVVLAAGAFDARRIIDLHWERMLPPRRRGGEGTGRERIEGSLGGQRVAIAVDAVCGLLARSEHDGHLVDPVLDRPAGGEAEPGELIRWHLEGAPAELDDTTTAALTASLRWTELRADAVAEGLRVTLVLAGPLPDNTPARMTRLLDAISLSPVGGAVGADDWLHAQAATWTHEGDEWRGALVVPWRGLRALVSLARGSVGSPTRHEL